MPRYLLTVATTTFMVLGTETNSRADGMPVAPHGESVDYSLRSGDRANEFVSRRSVFQHLVSAPNAAWMRLSFSELVLEGNSTIRMTSLLDSEVQELNAASARQWRNSSAYFNGESVLLEIIADPGTRRNRIAIEEITVEVSDDIVQPVGASGQCGICGTDDRLPSNVNWAARLMPVGCTASVFNSCSCMISAGHCVTSGMVVEFNVPNSLSNCTLVHPPVADQFPITSFTYSAVDIGNDWAVLNTGTNSQGQHPYDRYGEFRPVAGSGAGVGNAIAIWGYGMDTNCFNNQRQQTSSGNVNVVSTTFFQFSADLRSGNSGTAVIRNGEIIGVVTNCMVGCPNVATAMSVPAFAAARSDSCSCQAVACPADLTGDFSVNIYDVLALIQHWGACPPSPNECVGDIVPAAPFGVDIQDLMAVVDSWGSCP